MKRILPLVAVLATLVVFIGGNIPTAQAAQAPPYGMMPFVTAAYSGTADANVLSAPGTDSVWVVTSISYNVLVEEADATVVVEDDATTAINIIEVAPEVQGFGVTYDFGAGITCSQNSGVSVDFSGSTADAWLILTAFKQRVE